MKVGFFVGCNTAFNRPDLEKAVRYVFPALGIELDNLEGQSCCPTWGTMPSIDLVGWCALGARNYAIAEEKGVDMITVCSTCHGSLARTAYRMQTSPEVRNKVNELLKEVGREFRGTARIRHAVRYLYKEVGPDEITKLLKHRLDGLTVAIQPGCLSLWPKEVFIDKEEDTFHPKVLRELCEALGVSAPHYKQLLECCGMGGMRSTDMEKSFRLVERKMTSMKKEINPDLIVTGCSSCLIQFDTSQEFLQKKGRIYFEIPVLHYMQVLAICLGAEPKMVTGLSRTPVDNIIKRILQG
ncbi:MAG: heterodisulfide reductase [Ammonifex sp.]|jgi:heterodisulfide reductase subunit B|nr:MAG: heterodisulfide reductase [Ammonifex sp.]